MDVFHGVRDGVSVLKISLGSITKSFIVVTSGTSSRLQISSKSLPGVLEDSDVLHGAGDGVRVLKISQGSFT